MSKVKKKRMKQYLDKRCRGLLKHIYIFCATRETEELHDIRVEYKKINAMLFLLSNCSDRPVQTHQKEIKAIFKQAGEIRDKDIHLRILSDYHASTATFRNEQEENIKAETEIFCSHVKGHRTDIEKFKKKKDRIIFAVSAKQITRLFEDKLDDLHHYFGGPFRKGVYNDNELHEKRKLIKILLYIYSFLPSPIREKLYLNREYLHQLQDMIGNWHDTIITMNLVRERRLASNTILLQLEQKRGSYLTKIKDHAAIWQDKIKAANASATDKTLERHALNKGSGQQKATV